MKNIKKGGDMNSVLREKSFLFGVEIVYLSKKIRFEEKNMCFQNNFYDLELPLALCFMRLSLGSQKQILSINSVSLLRKPMKLRIG